MKVLVSAGLALGLLVAAQGARAADLSVAPLYKAPPAAGPAYNWSGFYLGVNGGGGWGDSHWQGIGRVDTSGGQAGGTAGYNWQFGQGVFGLEGDIDWSGVKGSSDIAGCPGGTCSTSSTGCRRCAAASATRSTVSCPISPAVSPSATSAPAHPECPATATPIPGGPWAAASS